MLQVNWSHPCTQPFHDSIVERFASWNVDLLKVYQRINYKLYRHSKAFELIRLMAPQIKMCQMLLAFAKRSKKTGRDIWFTLSAWPVPVSIADQVIQYFNIWNLAKIQLNY